ncbi:MAG: hypothetical protein U1F15_12505 [Burkholderiales bacterium]
MRGAVALAAALAAATAAAQAYTIEGGCRDGQPHGAYELRGAGGQVRVVGAFNRGKRMGSFLFWSSAGVRIAQLPYDEDVLTGTLAAWYAGGSPAAEPRPKLEAVYASGRPSGVQRSWYPNGNVRAEFRYDNGALVEARAFGESGKPLTDAQARALAEKDGNSDAQFIASLEAIVRAHLPRCEPASDRLEKG